MSWPAFFRTVLLASAVAGAATVMDAAQATERPRDLIYADSYGNLVIYSRAGYKRIIVGQGHLASELNAYANDGAEEPRVVRRHDGEAGADCYYPPYLWKGRSYMYGLSEGEIPQPPLVCSRQ
ncbi:MAG: hypothetical protein J0H34_14090 [Rhizobiales bacterium]|nr:hypothetical protein [Hyphomicrobiales bacterium]